MYNGGIMYKESKDKEGNQVANVSIHGWNSDVTFSYGKNSNGGMLTVDMTAYIDAKQPQCIDSQIGVNLTDGEIDELIKLLNEMKKR